MSYVKRINGYDIKDEGARKDIEDIKSGVTGSMHWIGNTNTQISDGDNTRAITAEGLSYSAIGIVVNDLQNSTYTRFPIADKVFETEYCYAWGLNEGTSSEKIVYTNTLDIETSGNKTEVWKVDPNNPQVTIHAGYTDDYYGLTGVQIELKNGYCVGYGSLEFVWIGTKWTKFGNPGETNNKKLETKTITGVGGSTTVHDTPTLNKSSIGSASGWNTGNLPEMIYDGATETLTFNPGSLPTLTVTPTQVGTDLTEGTEKTVAIPGLNRTYATGQTTTAEGETGAYVVVPNN